MRVLSIVEIECIVARVTRNPEVYFRLQNGHSYLLRWERSVKCGWLLSIKMNGILTDHSSLTRKLHGTQLVISPICLMIAGTLRSISLWERIEMSNFEILNNGVWKVLMTEAEVNEVIRLALLLQIKRQVQSVYYN